MIGVHPLDSWRDYKYLATRVAVVPFQLERRISLTLFLLLLCSSIQVRIFSEEMDSGHHRSQEGYEGS
jgi:hypothetical protein